MIKHQFVRNFFFYQSISISFVFRWINIDSCVSWEEGSFDWRDHRRGYIFGARQSANMLYIHNHSITFRLPLLLPVVIFARGQFALRFQRFVCLLFSLIRLQFPQWIVYALRYRRKENTCVMDVIFSGIRKSARRQQNGGGSGTCFQSLYALDSTTITMLPFMAIRVIRLRILRNFG